MKDILLLLILFIILLAISSGEEKIHCDPIPSGLYCVTTDQKKVPSNLPSAVTILKMEHNKVKELTSTSFKEYRFIKDLNLEGNRIESISADAFSGLKYLTQLNLKHNHRLKSLKNLPASLEFLDLSSCDQLNYNDSSYLSNLKSLKQLYLQDAKLTEFPKLGDVGGSLETLDVQDNDGLVEIYVADLAPLCKLKYLYVTIHEMKGDPCNCLAVQLWIRQHDIKGSNITCGNNGKTVTCERPIDLSVYGDMRRNCHLTSTLKTYWIYGAGILVILLFIVCSYIICKRMKCNQISVLEDEET